MYADAVKQMGSEDAKRDYLVSYLSDMIMLAQAAEEKRLQDDPDFKRHAAFARKLDTGKSPAAITLQCHPEGVSTMRARSGRGS